MNRFGLPVVRGSHSSSRSNSNREVLIKHLTKKACRAEGRKILGAETMELDMVGQGLGRDLFVPAFEIYFIMDETNGMREEILIPA